MDVAREGRSSRPARTVESAVFMLFGDAPALSWEEIFGASRPVEIEIGCGKGAFLLALARAHPERSFLGLEVQGRWVRLVRERLEEAPLENVRVYKADASIVIPHFVRDASVAAVHVSFPDPWWKRRHAKRRLITPAFARELRRVLEPGGVVWLATDVAERYRAMLDALAAGGLEVERLEHRAEGLPETNFERKYRLQGRPMYYARAIKR